MVALIKRVLLKHDKLYLGAAYIYSLFGRNKVRGRRNLDLQRRGAFLCKCRIDNYGKGNKVFIGADCKLKCCQFEIHGDNNIVEISRGVTGSQAQFYVSDGSVIKVGPDVDFSGEIEIASLEGATVSIGESCLFSSGIRIRNGDSHSIFDADGHRINHAVNVVIGDRVWVGQQVAILKGADIGSGSVIGMRSLVTNKSYPKNCVLVGTPARMVKSNITWDYRT